MVFRSWLVIIGGTDACHAGLICAADLCLDGNGEVAESSPFWDYSNLLQAFFFSLIAVSSVFDAS